jgi:hypothetical protein
MQSLFQSPWDRLHFFSDDAMKWLALLAGRYRVCRSAASKIDCSSVSSAAAIRHAIWTDTWSAELGPSA